MSGVELSMLYGSTGEQACADLRQVEKQHVRKDGWIGVYARVCTILSGKHHRHRIMSRYGTEQQNNYQSLFSYPVVARVSRCVAVVLLFERRRSSEVGGWAC